MKRTDAANRLRKIADLVESGDSAEGNIQWLLGEPPEEVDVIATVRTGNLEGQGGVETLDTRVVTDPSDPRSGMSFLGSGLGEATVGAHVVNDSATKPDPDRCPSCDSPDVSVELIEERFNYGTKHPVELIAKNIPQHSCSACGFTWTDHVGEAIREQTVHDFLATPEGQARRAGERQSYRARTTAYGDLQDIKRVVRQAVQDAIAGYASPTATEAERTVAGTVLGHAIATRVEMDLQTVIDRRIREVEEGRVETVEATIATAHAREAIAAVAATRKAMTAELAKLSPEGRNTVARLLVAMKLSETFKLSLADYTVLNDAVMDDTKHVQEIRNLLIFMDNLK